MGLMCVLWSRAVNCQLGPDSLTCHDIANCHKRPDLIPTQQNKPLVRLMENIDFWLPASSISPLSRVCLTKWSGVTIAVPGHKLCPGDKLGPHRDCYVCRFVIFVIRSRVKTGSSHKWPGARCRQPFTPVVCQTNVTYLVYWAFYPALRPVTWALGGHLKLPILVNTLQDKGPIVLTDINKMLNKTKYFVLQQY